MNNLAKKIHKSLEPFAEALAEVIGGAEEKAEATIKKFEKFIDSTDEQKPIQGEFIKTIISRYTTGKDGRKAKVLCPQCDRVHYIPIDDKAKGKQTVPAPCSEHREISFTVK